MAGRTIAIGDIHGCAAALRSVLDAIAPTSEDTIITLGDYIDRGPNSHNVVEQLLALEPQCELIPLIGNHELMLLIAKHDAEHLPWWKECGGFATLLSYRDAQQSTGEKESRDTTSDDSTSEDETEEIPDIGLDVIPESHWKFFESCALAYEMEKHIFVHANYDENTPLDEQDEEVLLWQHLNAPPGPHVSGKKVIVGHTPQLSGEILDLDHLVCIDTYCFGTGWLTAYEIHTGETWQANRAGELRSATA